MNTVYLLYQEISDQLGTSEVVGVYTSNELAQKEQATIRNHRSYVRPLVQDASPVVPK